MLKKYHKYSDEVGTDEAGRGCLAGPVTAAAVILSKDYQNELLTDSKLLSEKNRLILEPLIKKESVCFGIAHIFEDTIDEINILNASIYSMHRALAQLKTQPEHIIIDGNRFKPYGKTPYQTIVKGDGKYFSIAAASVLAKTYRDDYMLQLHAEFPNYRWDKNKGYPTKDHRAAIAEFGITEHHRKTFRLLDEQLKLDL